jgi:hypothetical protein
MEDRELSGVERELRRYLSSQLDRLPVRSTPSFAPRPRHWVRTAVSVPATMLVVLVAIGLGLGLADWRAHRTPDESQASAGGIPGPLNLAGGAPSLGFGLVSTSANTLLVRNETTEAAPLTFTNALPQVAVSPDGHAIAYWLSLLDSQTGKPTVYQLTRSDLLDPSVRNRAVMRAPGGEVPGPVVWSSDGTGLIANTHTAPTRGSDAGSPRAHASWFTIDVASAKATELPPGFENAVTTVYAWDRSRDLITGSGIFFGSPSVAGGAVFFTFKGNVAQSHVVPSGGLIAAADLYAKSVVIAYAGGCKGPPVDSTLRCPVLEVRDQATFAIVTGSPPVEATSRLPDVVFRPRSQDLIVQLPLPNGDARVELWSDLGRGPHQVLATYTQSVRFTGPRELILPRADGSAVFLLKFDDSAGGRWFGEIVSLGPTSTTRSGLGPERTPFEIQTGGNPLASVVLDPAFARALEGKTSAPVASATLAPAGLPIGDESARVACAGQNGGAPLLAAFTSTAGIVADWVENKSDPTAPHPVTEWRSMPAGAPAYLCYFGGTYAVPGGPTGPTGSGAPASQPVADRALWLVDSAGRQIGPAKYGPSTLIPLVRPGGARF